MSVQEPKRDTEKKRTQQEKENNEKNIIWKRKNPVEQAYNINTNSNEINGWIEIERRIENENIIQ